MMKEIFSVTAVPCICGEYDEGNRQSAILVREQAEDGGEIFERLIFGGYETPTSDEELEDIFETADTYEIDSNWETLETVREVRTMDIKELACEICEVFEDFLAEKGIDIPNPEKDEAINDGEDPEYIAILYGTDWGNIVEDVSGVLKLHIPAGLSIVRDKALGYDLPLEHYNEQVEEMIEMEVR